MRKIFKILLIVVAIGLYMAAMLELYLAIQIFRTLFVAFTAKNLLLMIVFVLSAACLIVFAASTLSKSEDIKDENH